MAAIELTAHAVDRFVERVATTLNRDQARGMLERYLPQARPTGERMVDGTPVWAIDALGALVVVREDRGRLTCTTVLEPRGRGRKGWQWIGMAKAVLNTFRNG